MKNIEGPIVLRKCSIGLAGLIGLSFFSLPQPVHAQSLPMPPGTTAGTLLRQNQQLLTPSVAGKPGDSIDAEDNAPSKTPGAPQRAEPHVHVQRFVVDESLPEPAATHVRKLFAHFEGRELSFSEVARVRTLLNVLLRSEVDVLAYATLPPQEVNDGTVRFEIHRGRIEKVSLDNTSLVSTAVLEHYLPTNRTGEAPTLNELEQAIRQMQALPGVAQARPSLSPGEAVGTTDVQLQAKPDARVQGALVVDNSGSASSGRNRAGAQLAINSPLGIGDRLQGVAFYAPRWGQDHASAGGNTVIGQLSYEIPLGYSGVRAGASYTRLQYRQGGPNQDVFDGNGAADVAGIYVNKPLIDRDDASLTVGTTLDYKRLRDGFFDIDSKRRSVVGGIRVSGSKQGTFAGQPNAVQFDAALQTGSLTQRELGLFDDEEFPTAGRFTRFSGNFEYAQKVVAGFTASVKGSVQLASRHLDGSEQMSIGGAQGVRGYGPELPGVDRGALVQVALSRQIDPVPGLSVSTFYDYGRGQINKDRSLDGAANTFTVQSAGIGLSYQYNQKVAVSLSEAWRIGASPAGQPTSKAGQTWISAMLVF
ncbi:MULTISPECIES: ShlB/FhaC/HecB family hemolysin secretion/activation protein [Burkholderia]|nr:MULTISPECIES: ShlB/FhaC/HecB family hemolysin secretion/activation protein [Burkholderia]